MTRRVWLAFALLLVAAGGGAWWWSAHRLSAILWQGYVEADFVKVGPTQPGLLTAVNARRGDAVAAGDLLFTQDDADDRAARDQARHQLAQAEKQLANLEQGAKPTEIEQAEANLVDANANLVRIAADLGRGEALLPKGDATKQSVDQLRSDFQSAKAKVERLRAALAQARGPMGRESEIEAQRAAVAASRAALEMAEWRLSQRRVAAPAAGRVADVLARPGETMVAGAPVVSLLPPGNIFIRFFVPETALSMLHQGDQVALACDACPAGLAATISFIAPQAEFTPPLIYSESSKAKLVFMIEAHPRPEQAATFNPGQPIVVRPIESSSGERRVP